MPDTDTPNRPRRKPFRWTRRILIGLAAFYVLAAAARLAWGWYAQRELDQAIAAARQIDPAMVRSDLRRAAVENPETASLYSAASDAAKAWLDARPAEETWQRVDEWLQEAQETGRVDPAALALLEAVRPQLDALPALADRTTDQETPSQDELYPSWMTARRVARLLALSAWAEAIQGRSDRAVVRLGQILHLGRSVQRGDEMVPWLMGTAIRALAADTAANLAPRLTIGPGATEVNPDALLVLMQALADDQPSRDAFREALRLDRITALERIGPPLPEPVAEGVEERHRLLSLALGPMWTLNEARGVLWYGELLRAGRMNHLDEALRIVEPATLSMDWRQHDGDLLSAARSYEDLFTYDALKVFRLRFRAKTGARLAALRLAWALHVHRSGGQPPADLEVLARLFDSDVLDDPLQSGGRLQILRDGEEAILASATVASVQEARRMAAERQDPPAVWIDPSRRPMP